MSLAPLRYSASPRGWPPLRAGAWGLPWPRQGAATPPRCCPRARCSWWAALAPAVPWPPPSCIDPVTGTWAATGSLAQARGNHTATLLPSGQVLVVGGEGPSGTLTTAELYDPATGTWSATSSLFEARGNHTATLLPAGQVLVVGGEGSNGALTSAELYDPATGTWSTTGALAQARSRAAATLLPSGEVLVVGGADSSGALASGELYDPATGTWTTTGSLAQARSAPTATLLPSGKVLVAGGVGSGNTLTSAELYDAGHGHLGRHRPAPPGSLQRHGDACCPRAKCSSRAALWPAAPLAGTELYDPATGTWAAPPSLAHSRWNHTATLLPSGQVLVVGGTGSNGPAGQRRAVQPGRRLLDCRGRAPRRPRMITWPRCCLRARCSSRAATTARARWPAPRCTIPATGTWTGTGSLAQRPLRAHGDAAALGQGARRGWRWRLRQSPGQRRAV